MKQEMMQLRKEGKSYAKIAKILGCSQGSVENHCKNRIGYCLECGAKPVPGSFCNSQCFANWDYKKYICEWKEGKKDGNKAGGEHVSAYVRRYLFKKYDNKCCRCTWTEINPYTKLIPLEVNHIDGHSSNTIEENLELLCPNCHSLTSNYRNQNKGNGRESRRK